MLALRVCQCINLLWSLYTFVFLLQPIHTKIRRIKLQFKVFFSHRPNKSSSILISRVPSRSRLIFSLPAWLISPNECSSTSKFRSILQVRLYFYKFLILRFQFLSEINQDFNTTLIMCNQRNILFQIIIHLFITWVGISQSMNTINEVNDFCMR